MAPDSRPFRGSRVVRGPMASDHYTQVHNLAVRGAIPTRYVGVFAFICSHQEGWTLTAKSVATQLKVGVDFVDSALHAIEKAHCLIRARERDAAGKLGGSVWFVTDLPLQMRQLGITDDTLIAEHVRATYEQWLADQTDDSAEDDDQTGADPNPENPMLDATSENSRSEPKPGFPVLADPVLADPVHKNTSHKKTRGKKTIEEPGGTLPPDPRRPHDPPTSGHGTDSRDASSDPHQQPPQAVDRNSRPRVREDLAASTSDPNAADGQQADTGAAGSPPEATTPPGGTSDTRQAPNDGHAPAQATGQGAAEDARTTARTIAAAARSRGRTGGRRPAVPRQTTPAEQAPDPVSVAT